MTEKNTKLGLGNPNKGTFDPTQLEAGTSFQKVNEDGTAAQPQPGFSQPPPAEAGPMPGIQGQLPMGAGHIISAASLTAGERAALEKIGWKEGQAIPGNLPELLANEQRTAAQQAMDTNAMLPPGDPSAVPPLQMPGEQNLEDLPPEKQAAIRAAMEEAQRTMEEGSQPFQPASEGVGHAAQGVVHRTVDIDEPKVVDDRQSETYASGEPKRQQASSQEQPRTSATASQAPGPKRCPHCDWDLAMPDSAEPTAADRQTFLQAILGGTAWQKSFKLLGDQLNVTVRQLTQDEVDACYTQVHFERDQGKIDSKMDYWEQLTRYRACLQLVDYRSGEHLATFPESYAAWGGQDDKTNKNPTTLPLIQHQIREQVVKTESLQRLIASIVAEFNRLSAKMEANIRNPDFWQATESRT